MPRQAGPRSLWQVRRSWAPVAHVAWVSSPKRRLSCATASASTSWTLGTRGRNLASLLSVRPSLVGCWSWPTLMTARRDPKRVRLQPERARPPGEAARARLRHRHRWQRGSTHPRHGGGKSGADGGRRRHGCLSREDSRAPSRLRGLRRRLETAWPAIASGSSAPRRKSSKSYRVRIVGESSSASARWPLIPAHVGARSSVARRSTAFARGTCGSCTRATTTWPS
jgi:hypothetical protein